MFGKPSVYAVAVLLCVKTTLGCGAGVADVPEAEGGSAGSAEGGAGEQAPGGANGQDQGGADAGGNAAGMAGGNAGRGGAGGQGGVPAGMGGTSSGMGGTSSGMGGTSSGMGGTAAANPYNLPTNRPLLIQPLGDSITEGKGTDQEASYRRPLWKKLKAAGYNVDFVGSRKVQLGDAPPFFKDYDPDHEGHYGWRLSEIIRPENIEAWLKLYTPDVALVHLGTNDSDGGAPALLANTETLVKKLRADNPAVVILLAQLIQPGPVGQSFNSMLPGLAQRLTTPMSPILVVNQAQGFTTADTIDGIHPNPMGQEKMATKWFASLATFLPKP